MSLFGSLLKSWKQLVQPGSRSGSWQSIRNRKSYLGMYDYFWPVSVIHSFFEFGFLVAKFHDFRS